MAADLELSASAHLRLSKARREQKEYGRAAQQTRAAAKKTATPGATPRLVDVSEEPAQLAVLPSHAGALRHAAPL